LTCFAQVVGLSSGFNVVPSGRPKRLAHGGPDPLRGQARRQRIVGRAAAQFGEHVVTAMLPARAAPNSSLIMVRKTVVRIGTRLRPDDE